MPERLVAMETILMAGHIPAAMEQFTAGDETAWERIQRWIDESDAFLLILGGRYGSIEPESRQGYVELEYDYALSADKPFMSLVLGESGYESWKNGPATRLELDRPDRYWAFRDKVTKQHCAFWDTEQEIRVKLLQKLPEWASRTDLVGWVPGDQAPDVRVASELARLSIENDRLRTQLTELSGSDSAVLIAGIRVEEMVALLRDEPWLEEGRVPMSSDWNRVLEFTDTEASQCSDLNLGHAFEWIASQLPNTRVVDFNEGPAFQRLLHLGLVMVDESTRWRRLTADGQHLLNRLRIIAPSTAERMSTVWSTSNGADASDAD